MADPARFEVGKLLFDAGAGELNTRAQVRRLEPRAAAVLAALCSQCGTVVSRQLLLDKCWGEGEGSDEALTQAVAQIRRAIEELGERPDLIETLAKRGYRLRSADPEVNSNPSAPARPGAGRTKRRRWVIAAAALLLILLATWLVLPHGARHWLRHTLGWGPSTSSGQH